MSKVAIFLYDFTGLMAKPWLDAGYECWLFDGQHQEGVTREGNLFKVGMWFHHDQVEKHAANIARMVGGKADFVFGFPECTHLTVAGAKHFAKKAAANPAFQTEAIRLAKLVFMVSEACDCDRWALENPVGVMSTIWRKPDHVFQPCDYGGYLPEDDAHPVYPEVYPPRDAYNKTTCIWSGSDFVMPSRRAVEPRQPWVEEMWRKVTPNQEHPQRNTTRIRPSGLRGQLQMKTFEFQYLNYEGSTPTSSVDVEDDQDEADAKIKAILEATGNGDGIREILDIYQVSQS